MRAQSESFKRLAVGIAAAKQGPGPAVSMAPFGMDDIENVLSESLALKHATSRMLRALDRYWDEWDARSETIDCDLWANAWWDAFEKYRAKVEKLLAMDGVA